MSPEPSTRNFARPAIAVAVVLIAGAAILASGALGRAAEPDPSGSPMPAPTERPVVPPQPAPSEAPIGGIVKVDLDVRSGHSVSVLVDDGTGSLADAQTGTPGDGMTVRWHDAAVENLDDSTLRVLWSGWPRDEEVTMSISKVGGVYEILITQAAPAPNTDAMGFDRILELNFDSPISADDVNVTFKDVAV